MHEVSAASPLLHIYTPSTQHLILPPFHQQSASSRGQPESMSRTAALLVLIGSAVSHSLSASSVFFDTNGRLQRSASPAGGCRRYVPVHEGHSLLEPHGDGWRPALLAPEEVERDAGCIEAFLGTVSEGVLAADAGEAVCQRSTPAPSD